MFIRTTRNLINKHLQYKPINQSRYSIIGNNSFNFITSVTSALFIPGNQEKMLNKSLHIHSDVLVPDCEDSVPNHEKNKARELISSFLIKNKESLKNKVIFPRINAVETDYFICDTNKLFTYDVLSIVSGFTIPKIDTIHDIEKIDDLLTKKEIELKFPINKFKLIIWIESTLGIINMKDIYSKGKNRILASAFGLEDYCNNLGITRTQDMKELEIVRNLHSITAHAFNITALDGSYVEFKNHEGLEKEINYVKRLGYKGKFACNSSFSSRYY